MEDGLLSLKWNNHKTTFFEILRVLRDKANYTDATLAVEGNFYPVHKLVLSTCSEYFSEIFERTPCKCPVIVLKDVRSQDLESLLDYMYLGEVNVNQNDLALLLKTAECLRIKGLAVPDDDPNRHSNTSTPHQKVHSLSTDEATKDIPPAKRRKEDTSASTISPPRISPTSKVPSSPPHTPSSKVNKVAPEPSSPGEHLLDTPLVKVEMEEVEDGEEAFQSDTNYDSNTEMENREFTVEKSEHDPSTYPNTTNFSLTSTQQAGEMSWEDGENSFPQEAFGGDSGQQAGGDDDEDDDEDVDVTSLSPHCNPFLNLSLTQSREARRCQLCQVTLANANLLRRHVEDHHFHIRKYDCVHCGKKFKRKEHRERHERIHTGEKPFACHICTSRFTQKEHLKGHVENVHHKHLRERDKDASSHSDSRCDTDNDREGSTSSPPSLASPSSLNSFMAASLASLLPSTMSHMNLPSIPSLSSLASMPALASMPSLAPVSSPSAILPSTSEGNRSMMALYAPVSRKTVDSPTKHVQTITINFN